MIDGFDVVHVQLFGQLVGIDPITLAAIVEQCILSRITDLDSKETRKSPRSPSMNCKMALALVSMTLSITTLPTEFLTQIERFPYTHPDRYI